MAIVAVAGDASTTTSVALAAAWPIADEVIVVEADPGGGDLAAWFDMPVLPSLSTVVTSHLTTSAAGGEWAGVERLTRLARSGLRLVPAPVRATEAQQAVVEAGRAVVPTLAALRAPVTVADTGRLPTAPVANPFVGSAAVVVLVHRQAAPSARAAGARLERLAEQLDSVAALAASPVVAVVGSRPFAAREIEAFLADGADGAGGAGACPVVPLPVDDLTAAVLAGRTGVSARRLARLPLMRAAGGLAAAVRDALALAAPWSAR